MQRSSTLTEVLLLAALLYETVYQWSCAYGTSLDLLEIYRLA